MIKMDIKNVIVKFVEALLPHSTKDKALLVNLELASGEVREDIGIIIYRPSNYTKVLVQHLEDGSCPHIHYNSLPWSLESNHDSCWKIDGLSKISNTAYRLMQETDEEVTIFVDDVKVLNIHAERQMDVPFTYEEDYRVRYLSKGDFVIEPM